MWQYTSGTVSKQLPKAPEQSQLQAANPSQTSRAAGRQSRPKVILVSITARFVVKYHSL